MLTRMTIDPVTFKDIAQEELDKRWSAYDDCWGDPEQSEKMMMGQWSNLEGYQCPRCGSTHLRKDGFVHHKQRYRCKNCGLATIAPLGRA